MNEARQTTAQISFAGVDISKEIRKYLLSISYTDAEEDASDDLQIKLEDRSSIWLESWLSDCMDAASGEVKVSAAGQSAESVKYTVNAKSGLILRSGPSKETARVNSYPFGTEVSVLDASGSWYRVDVNGQQGYMWGAYLTAAGVNSGSSVSGYPTLRFGANNDYVKQMQTLLTQKGFPLPVYGVDGYFGSETQGAVEAFQKASGLTVTGVCDEITWAALLASGGTSASDSGFLIRASFIRKNWNDGHGDELDCGSFELDKVRVQGPPETVTIKATALPFSKAVRQTKKDKAWESYKLSGIAAEIAKNAGMTCMFLSDLDIQYKRKEQKQEADIAFLSKLCHDSGLSLKVTNNILVIFDQASYESADPIMSIKRNDGSYLKYDLSTEKAQVQYASCRVSYVTPEGRLIEATVKASDYDEKEKGNQQLEIKAKVADIGEAQKLAKMRLRYHNKFQKTISFTCPGNPDLVSGMCVHLDGFGPWNGKYIIREAKHTLARSAGYTTQISLRRILGGY